MIVGTRGLCKFKMIHNPYKIVQMFEEEMAIYTGATYAVAVSSCTDALLMCCAYEKVKGKEAKQMPKECKYARVG